MKTLILTPIIILLAIGCKKIDKKVEIIPNPKIEEKTPKAKALSYAIETKELLGKNLQEKMKQGGAENALEFCNVNAIPLTESVAKNHKINIKRVSDQPRNQLNIANEKEIKYINLFKERIANMLETNIDIKDSNLISCSIGISYTVLNEKINLSEFINNADKCLYKAKRSGKGKYVIFNDDEIN